MDDETLESAPAPSTSWRRATSLACVAMTAYLGSSAWSTFADAREAGYLSIPSWQIQIAVSVIVAVLSGMLTLKCFRVRGTSARRWLWLGTAWVTGLVIIHAIGFGVLFLNKAH